MTQEIKHLSLVTDKTSWGIFASHMPFPRPSRPCPNQWKYFSNRERRKIPIPPSSLPMSKHIECSNVDKLRGAACSCPLVQKGQGKESKECLRHHGSHSMSPKSRLGPKPQPAVLQYRVVGAHMKRSLEEVVRMDVIVYATSSGILDSRVRRRS